MINCEMTFDENIHPCKGCEDYVPRNGCKSKGGCGEIRKEEGMKESKELKAARRDRVTRKVKMATLELTALTEGGPVQWIEKVRANYPSQEWLREKFKRELMKDYKVLTGFRVIEESYGLYGMEEDAFFASAELIMTLPL